MYVDWDVDVLVALLTLEYHDVVMVVRHLCALYALASRFNPVLGLSAFYLCYGLSASCELQAVCIVSSFALAGLLSAICFGPQCLLVVARPRRVAPGHFLVP